MSVFSTDAKNSMLDSLTVNEVQLHNGDPGASGTANRVGGVNGEEPVTMAAASDGTRNPTADVEFTGLDADQPVTWVSWWDSGTTTFQGKGEVTGDTAANAAGEWTLTTASSLNLDDPA